MREKVLMAVTPHTSWATEGRGALTPPAPVDVALSSQFDLSFLNAGRRFPYSAAACQIRERQAPRLSRGGCPPGDRGGTYSASGTLAPSPTSRRLTEPAASMAPRG